MTDQKFPIHSIESAPEQAKPLLEETHKSFGMIPNLERVMSSSPQLLSAYVKLWDDFSNTSLSEIEQQVVYQTANFINNCEYCVPWHTLLSKQAQMPEEVSSALREGQEIPDQKLMALHSYTKALIEHKGEVPPEVSESFYQVGYTSKNALEVIMGLAIKLMSNYTNHIAETPLDSVAQKYEWKKPPVE